MVQAEPKKSHVEAAKRIIRYVKGTINKGLLYPFETSVDLAGYCRITGYSDAYWAGCAEDRKSTSGACFYFGNYFIAWHCKKQTCISLSTREAEYVAAGSGCTELLWPKYMLADYGISQGTMTLFCDNTSTINI